MSNRRALLVTLAVVALVGGSCFCLLGAVWLYAAFPH